MKKTKWIRCKIKNKKKKKRKIDEANDQMLIND